MPDLPDVEPLHHSRYVVVVVRLLVNAQAGVESGELVGAEGHTLGRFRRLSELPILLDRWLQTTEPRAAPGATPPGDGNL